MVQPRIEQSHDVTRNNILKDEKHQIKCLLLRFPPKMELTNAAYSPESTDGEIELDIVPFKSEFSIADGGEQYTTWSARVSWRVSLVQEVRKVKASSPPVKNKAAEKLAAKLSSMSMN